ncbi:MAG: cAMP-binding protein [Bacteroidota bacterium]|nr:MAG: cAMP-binding protein [Bacteroidota bacterium]HNR74076.1 Crp/Fnr family transcriptional regulator [Cyclobacteriaceae bacterium]HNU42295.1 Crp/Fnr family transcriptional regulator [Cyclobacteriaceae bacterium]
MNTSGAQIFFHIKKHITTTPEEEQFFISLLNPLKLKQGEFAEKAGDVTYSFIHVTAGCLMTYYTDKEGNDQVIQFATAGWWTGDLHSLTSQQPSIYTTRALADSEMLLLPKVRMEELLERYPKFERYFRIMFQNSLVTHQNRIIEAFTATAEERYHNFQKKYPQLEQYVPLKYIASYLGITPEFLSKIRRKK